MLMQPEFRHDPAFPHLADALDPDRAGAAFTEMFAATGFPVATLDCSVERARIKCGVKALIGYRLQGIASDGTAFDQLAMASLWPGSEPARLKGVGGALTPPGIGPPSAPLQALAGQAWLFPNDRKIHAIAALLEGPVGLIGGTCETVHYVPEQGCTVRLTHPEGTLYGKVRADDRGAVAVHVGKAAEETADLPVRLARIISYDPARRILWQEAVDGVALDPADALARAHFWAPRVASAIASFQQITPPDGLKALTVHSLMQNLAGRMEKTQHAMPELAEVLADIAARLAATCPAAGPLRLSHCDLHPGNLLWDGKSFALIDLDTAALAPPARDHGSLIASVIHAAIEAGQRDATILAMVSAHRDAARVAGLNWFIAASLIGERLYRCATRLKTPSFRTRSRLVDMARLLLEAEHG
jgi:aminoglycoside phosphotransferase (APT) family kinase protein